MYGTGGQNYGLSSWI